MKKRKKKLQLKMNPHKKKKKDSLEGIELKMKSSEIQPSVILVTLTERWGGGGRVAENGLDCVHAQSP